MRHNFYVEGSKVCNKDISLMIKFIEIPIVLQSALLD